MYPRTETVNITSDGTGVGTGYTGVIHGEILAVSYIKDGTNPYDNGVDFTITTETTLQAVLAVLNVAASKAWRPRAVVQAAADGSDLTGVESAYCAGERIKIVIAQATASKVGQFVITYA